MAEHLHIATGDKSAKYELLYRQVVALVEGEDDSIARMANIAAMIAQTFDFLWTGFYRVVGDELILGPFQGPMACTRIGYGRGVCGSSWAERRTIVVDDVEKFAGHIACSSLSRSEIVVPIIRGEMILGVLDIDSEQLATFDDVDALWLAKIVDLL
ncbi:MAG: GAF domain-containing protein [Alistipes sp.]|nr:GAF domain-containing protein [Alistipes sp.]